MKNPPSSTSPSSRAPALLRTVAPLLCALAALGLGALHLRRFDPQNEMRRRQIAIKEAALRRTSGDPGRLLVCGDSSVAFGIDPTVLREVTGLPCINLGYTAGCGALALLGVAEEAARAGDTLVVSILPSLMTGPVATEREGCLLAMMYGRPEIAVGGRTPLLPFTPTERLRVWLSACSPSERLMVNDLSRPLLGMKGFRYSECALDDWGYIRGKVILPHPFGPLGLDAPSPPWRHALETYAARLRARGVRVYYSLAWCQVPPGDHGPLRAATARYLADMGRVMEVLPDPGLGIKDDPALFADTGVHLTAAAAVERSRALGEALNARRGRDGPGGSPAGR